MGTLFLDNEKNKNLNIKIYSFRSSSIEEVNNYLRRCWNKCLKTPNKLFPAFKIKILKEDKWKTEKLLTLEYFRDKFQEKYQTDYNDSLNNSDAIKSNNVKNNISSKNNHSLICNDTMQLIDVSVISSKEKCDMPSSTKTTRI